VFCLKMT